MFLLKSLLGIVFIVAALTAALAMLTLMGKAEKKTSPDRLRNIHKAAGVVFGILLLTISFLCITYLAKAGDQVSPRAVLHSYLALFLVVIFFLKVTIALFFRQFLRIVPTLGMSVFVLAAVVFFYSAGYYFLRTSAADPVTLSSPSFRLPDAQGRAENGRRVFGSHCTTCHFADKEDWKVGPGLKGILKRDKLPASGRQAIPENILRQIRTPYLAMPSFPSLAGQELADLLAYLKTL